MRNGYQAIAHCYMPIKSSLCLLDRKREYATTAQTFHEIKAWARRHLHTEHCRIYVTDYENDKLWTWRLSFNYDNKARMVRYNQKDGI